MAGLEVVEVGADRKVVLDDQWIAPCLACSAAPPLTGLLAELAGLLNQRGEALAARLTAPGSRGVADVSDFLLLQSVNRSQKLLAHWASDGNVHPADLYAALVQMAGDFATFTEASRRPSDYPPYRHADLQRSFAPVIADLRRSLGVVLQETNLFTGTVMENIRYGRLEATDEECREAARLAGADDFITRLPDGYDTVLYGNGANLSQGQRQLLAIARAAVADPPVMILDEATSSIDTRTEQIVQKGMDQLMEGRTVFVIAHRLSTVMNADVIMVLDHGRIIERGSHDKLIADRGTYYNLYTGAFELE